MPCSAQLGRPRKTSRALLGFRGRRAAVLAVFLGFWAASPAVQALGLGALDVQSDLGSPLQATAPIQLGGGESAEGLEVAIASESDYQMVGKPRPAVVGALEVQLVDGGSPSIRLTSSRPIEDPLFEVMVRVSSDGNQVLKMYTVTLDPPQVTEPSASSDAAPQAAPSPARSADDGPARTASPRVQTQELPPQARQSAEAGSSVDRPSVQVTEGWAKRDRYGPVRSGDTLTTIIQRLRQDSSVPLESAVVATWKANQGAFIDGNMNLVQQGAVLDIPNESQVRQYQAGEAKAIIRKQREAWADRGQPSVKTSPGHERYQLKVSLQDPDGEAEQAGANDNDTEHASDQGGAPAAQTSGGDNGAATGNGGNEGGQASSAGSDQAGASQAAPESAAMVAELRTRITDLQESLRNQRQDSQATIQAMEKRLTGLQQQLEKQRKLVAQQNAAMERLANQPSGGGAGMPSRDRYILWLLAGVNLLMLLAIIALWRRLRAVQAGSAPASASEGADPAPEAAADPLTQANAQAAAGEFKQARSTLWEALAGDPKNWALYGRLLDLYEQEGDGDQFEEVARRLFDELGDDQPEWQEEIRTRGGRLKPESGLFAAGAAGAAAATAGAAPTFDFEGLDLEAAEPSKGAAGEPGTEEAGEGDFAASDAQAVAGAEEDDDAFDLDFEGGGGEAGGEEAPDQQPASPAAEEDLALDFDLGEEAAEPAAAEGSAAGEAPASETDGDEGLEFDLGIPESDGEAGEAPASETGEGGAEVAEPEDELVLSGWEADPGEASPEAEGESEEPDAGMDGLDLDLDLGEPEEQPASEGGGVAETETGGDHLEGLDFGEPDTEAEDADLELRGAGPGESAAGEGSEAPAASASADDGAGEELDFELSGWDDGSEDLDAEAGWSEEGPELEFGEEGAAEAAPEAPAEAPAGGGQDEDEFEIKLDLAQAWIDMGDQESARGLLQEVEGRGGPQQRERAQKMLGSLS